MGFGVSHESLREHLMPDKGVQGKMSSVSISTSGCGTLWVPPP